MKSMKRVCFWMGCLGCVLGVLGRGDVFGGEVVYLGERAPGFNIEGTEGEVVFPEDFSGKWVILFSFPSAFTPVCTTEMKVFGKLAEELKKKNVEFIGVTLSSLGDLKKWKAELKAGGDEIDFPLVSDENREILEKYGMVHAKESKEKMIRSVYFIDPKGVVRASFFYPFKNGRGSLEIKRLILALQEVDSLEFSVTPVDWKAGDRVLRCKSCAEAAKSALEKK